MENDRAFAEILNECLDAIESGRSSVQDCQADYPQHAAVLGDLLRLSGEVRAVSLPAPTSEMLAAGEQQLLQAVRSKAAPGYGQQGKPSAIKHAIASVKSRVRTWPRWVLPAAALSGGVAVLFACVLLALLGGGLAWRAMRGTGATPGSPPVVVSKDDRPLSPLPSPTAAARVSQVSPLPSPTVAPPVTQDVPPQPSPTAPLAAEAPPQDDHTIYLPLAVRPLPAHLAQLRSVRGLVEVRGDDGRWSLASDGQTVKAGRQLHTGALSSVDIVFYDGSTATLGPNTMLSIDALGQAPEDRSRVVKLTQWIGETDHDVAPSLGSYQVRTPSGKGEAKGTSFHVSVTAAQLTRFRVDEGAVVVTHLNVTVVVVAGQVTTIGASRPPSKPFFRVTGEGEVEAIGTTWQIAGQRFQTHDDTILVGNPQVGDWVSVDGHLIADGTRVAERIVLLRRAPENRFALTGEVEATGIVSWTVAGQTIAINAATAIDEGIEIGDRVRVEGRIHDGGTLLAESITLIAPMGVPFSFVGVVQEIADAAWTVSGISITVDIETVIADDLVVGDVVRVRGVSLEPDGGAWLAHSIKRLARPKQEFEFVGLVESIDPWQVSGIALETRMWTEISGKMAFGDRVKVEGWILAGGTWLAEEIKLVDEDDDEHEGLSFEFVGVVEDIEPWIVSGISLTVNYRTEIVSEITRGDRVVVEGRILRGGEWLATEIKWVDRRAGRGCMQFASLVVRVGASQVVLQNGATLPVGGIVQVEGEIAVHSVIAFQLCVDDDGEMTVIHVVVLYQMEPPIVVRPSPPPSYRPPSSDRDRDDDDRDRGDDDDDRDDGEGGKRRVTICHHHQGESGGRETMVVEWTAWINEHSRHGDTLGPCK
jgi:hypothetical protein